MTVNTVKQTTIKIYEETKQAATKLYEETKQVAKKTYEEVKPIVEKVAQVAFDVYGQLNSMPNTLLGLAAGFLGGGTPTLGPRGTIIFNNIKENSLTGKIMTKLEGNPITLGYVILNKDPQMIDSTMQHELGHVTQSAILGFYYLPLYGLDSFIHPKWEDKWMEKYLPKP